MNEKPMIYAAVYDNIDGALVALDNFERLQRRARSAWFDGAVIDKHNGMPRIAKCVDSATIDAIPELLTGDWLAEHPLYDAAEQLEDHEAALVVVGEPGLEKAFDRATTRATMTEKRGFATTTPLVALVVCR